MGVDRHHDQIDGRLLIFWHVSINNNQKTYIVEAETAGDACAAAGERWRNEDETVTVRQRDKGIYAIAARHAKFGETRQQLVVPVHKLP